jgi:hypothetical protein
MKEINRHWYLLDTITHIITGPFDFVQAAEFSVANPSFKGYVEIGNDKIGDSIVCTCFQGVDLNRWDEDVFPQQFETVVTGGAYNGLTRYYERWPLALEGHSNILNFIREECINNNTIAI